jgi:hypothetical protein
MKLGWCPTRSWKILSKSKATRNIDCFLANDFTTVIDPEILSLKLLKLKQKGLKLRMISDIGMKHDSFYRGFVNNFDIRHFDQIGLTLYLLMELTL